MDQFIELTGGYLTEDTVRNKTWLDDAAMQLAAGMVSSGDRNNENIAAASYHFAKALLAKKREIEAEARK